MTDEDRRRQALLDARPPLDTVLNMHDFETVARTVLPEKAWVRVAMSLSSMTLGLGPPSSRQP